MLAGFGEQDGWGPAGRGRRACHGDARVRLIFAGWLPQDGLFGWSAPLV